MLSFQIHTSLFRYNNFAQSFQSSQAHPETLAWTLESLKLSTVVHKDGGLWRLAITSWLHVKAAVGKIWGLSISLRRREVISGYSPNSSAVTQIVEGTWWHRFVLELGLFVCWKELSNNQDYSDICDGWYSHVGTYIPCSQLELHHFFIHLNIYLVILYGITFFPFL